MSYGPAELYELLPSVQRLRDAERGEVLKAFVTVLAEQGRLVEADIQKLLDNWFIETCDEWVVPYIGDLIGVRLLQPASHGTFSSRARVANTLAYRRRKGTATMLEQLARDTTGWPARVVEFFELLICCQNLNHLRFHSTATTDLRETHRLEWLDTPFDVASHTVDVRRISRGRGRHNIPNVGLFLWRLQAYPLTGVDARPVASPPDRRYTLSPLGLDIPLFNSPRPELEITHLSEAINVPGPLSRRVLYDELEARRAKELPRTDYFGPNPPFRVFINGEANPIPPEKLAVCDLSDWHLPNPASGVRAAIDPKLGRLTFPTSETPDEVLVDYAYGFSGDLGGGPYHRRESLRELRTLSGQGKLLEQVAWQAGVTRNPVSGPGLMFGTLGAAIGAWNTWSQANPGKTGVIAVMDSRTYDEDLTGALQIRIPESSLLLLVAADWPVHKTAAGATERLKGQLLSAGVRPHISGDITVLGTAASSSPMPGAFIMNGILLEGGLTVASGHLGLLHLQHSTIVPAVGFVQVEPGNAELRVKVERCICGTITLPDSVQYLEAVDTVIDGLSSDAIAASGALLNLQASTFLGAVQGRMLQAGNSIFRDKVIAKLKQSGCVRFCYVPANSSTPRQYRCQPELALREVSGVIEEQRVLLRVRPEFTSVTHGHPGYMQLKTTVPSEIQTGADDGSEMGAFRFLKQPQREANLRASLDEYLRFGLEAGLFYIT